MADKKQLNFLMAALVRQKVYFAFHITTLRYENIRRVELCVLYSIKGLDFTERYSVLCAEIVSEKLQTQF